MQSPVSGGVPGLDMRNGRATYNWNVHCDEFVPRTRPTAIVSPVNYKSPNQLYSFMYDLTGQVSASDR